MRARKTPLCLLMVAIVFLTPGCLVGSPLSAFSGEPYGMLRDDIKAIDGQNGPIWSGAPAFAFFDIPLAVVLDTAFLPISCLMWLILHAGDDDGDEGEADDYEDKTPRRHRHQDGTVHTH